MSCAIGDTFRFQPRFDTHLHVIISDPKADPDKIVTANFTSWRENKDQSCVVELGEHPQITHRSCIDYGHRIISLENFLKAVNDNLVICQPPVSDELLRRILRGASISPYIPLGNHQILIDQGLIDGD